MKNDKETRQKLLESAKKEFLEKGYMKASLRNICKNAGVTTGALYFFFEDKEDLFASLVDEPLHRLFVVMEQHYREELHQSANHIEFLADMTDDIKASKMSVHYMFEFYDEFQLILTKSQGSRFEHTIDQFVEITEQHYRKLADQMAKQMGTAPIDDDMIHWLSHMQIDTFVHLLTHEKSEESALIHIELILKYFISGWFGMF